MTVRSDRLRETRERLGLSQRELNRRCGFGEHQIYRYESEKGSPSSDHLKVMAEKLGISSDYLLGLSDDPKGQVGSAELDDNERDMVEVYRREGWPGVIRLGADRVGKP